MAELPFESEEVRIESLARELARLRAIPTPTAPPDVVVDAMRNFYAAVEQHVNGKLPDVHVTVPEVRAPAVNVQVPDQSDALERLSACLERIELLLEQLANDPPMRIDFTRDSMGRITTAKLTPAA